MPSLLVLSAIDNSWPPDIYVIIAHHDGDKWRAKIPEDKSKLLPYIEAATESEAIKKAADEFTGRPEYNGRKHECNQRVNSS